MATQDIDLVTQTNGKPVPMFDPHMTLELDHFATMCSLEIERRSGAAFYVGKVCTLNYIVDVEGMMYVMWYWPKIPRGSIYALSNKPTRFNSFQPMVIEIWPQELLGLKLGKFWGVSKATPNPKRGGECLHKVVEVYVRKVVLFLPAWPWWISFREWEGKSLWKRGLGWSGRLLTGRLEGHEGDLWRLLWVVGRLGVVLKQTLDLWASRTQVPFGIC